MITLFKRLWRLAFPRRPIWSVTVSTGIPEIFKWSRGQVVYVNWQTLYVSKIDYNAGIFTADYYG